MICAVGGLLGGILFFLSARHYPHDMDQVEGIELELEK